MDPRIGHLPKKKGEKDDVAGRLKSKITENHYINYSDIEYLGAYCVLGEKEKAYSYLQKVLKKEPIMKYTISGWPVLKPFLNDSKFQKALEPAYKKLKEI